ncbi:hypothetical protein NBRC116494_34320 [Aurantivibrio plasticivorans]
MISGKLISQWVAGICPDTPSTNKLSKALIEKNAANWLRMWFASCPCMRIASGGPPIEVAVPITPERNPAIARLAGVGVSGNRKKLAAIADPIATAINIARASSGTHHKRNAPHIVPGMRATSAGTRD